MAQQINEYTVPSGSLNSLSDAAVTVGYAQQLTVSPDGQWVAGTTFGDVANLRLTCGNPNCESCYPQFHNYQRYGRYDNSVYSQEMQRLILQLWDEMKKDKEKEKMAQNTSVSEQLANLEKNDEDRLLQEYGIVNADGSLTSEGEKVVMRRMLKNLKGELVADLQKLEDNKKSRKALKASS